uniref:Uncharacterized protein n=1 Tax=Emiliania huxleyi TaxID=2903 RepID=A0A7S3S7V3_EMIHU|mmetsp:Transcript_18229/g.53587  ORF Transcript_18229/g.53587 Transcript_18229/m.53587 type:complete len:400 (-) Transcript_18229:176-1375(-)
MSIPDVQPHRQVRRRRKSGEVLMARQATVGAGLNQLDSMIGEMYDIKRATLPTTRSVGHRSAASFLLTSALVLALSVLLPMVTHPRELLEAAGWQPSVCDDSCVHANDSACDDGGACRDGSDCGACGAREASLPVPSWAVIVASLVSIAVLSLGVSTVGEMARSAGGSWGRVPLTDATLGTAVLNKFANSAQVREKGLKVLQYVLKAGAYSRLFSAGLTKQLKDLSKATSTARRFFKFCRWVKHFEDLSEARDQSDRVMRLLLYFRVAANFGADWAEDVCSLERVGILPAGTLSVEFMLFAEYCQLALALVEIWVTSARARREAELSLLAEEAGVAAPKLLSQQRKLALVRLELVKFVSDVGKAIFDCELYFAHEGVFIGCALFSGILSTHKNMFKILK